MILPLLGFTCGWQAWVNPITGKLTYDILTKKLNILHEKERKNVHNRGSEYLNQLSHPI